MDECWMCEAVFGRTEANGVGVLGTFKGYTVDFRLKQFRKVPKDEPHGLIEFVDFNSPKGAKLCDQMHEAATKELNKRYGNGRKIFLSI